MGYKVGYVYLGRKFITNNLFTEQIQFGRHRNDVQQMA